MRTRAALLAAIATFASVGVSTWQPETAQAAPTCQNPNFNISGGQIDWGIKQSFRKYIKGPVAEGSWQTTGVGFNGDERGPSGAFRFPIQNGSGKASDLQIKTSGTVHFKGHGGTLDSRFSDLRLAFTSPTTANIVVDFAGKEVAEMKPGAVGKDVAQNGLVLAKAKFNAPLSTNSTRLSGTVDITTEGNKVGFNGAYDTPDARKADPINVNVAGEASCGDGTKVSFGSASGNAGGSTGGSNAGGAPAGKIEQLPNRPAVPQADYTVVEWGEVLTVSASGFEPNSQVALRQGKDTTDIGYAVADSDGNVSASIVIPEGKPTGTTSYTLHGHDTSGSALDATVNVRIVRSTISHGLAEGVNEVTDGATETQRLLTAGNNVVVAGTGLLGAVEHLAGKFGVTLPHQKKQENSGGNTAANSSTENNNSDKSTKSDNSTKSGSGTTSTKSTSGQGNSHSSTSKAGAGSGTTYAGGANKSQGATIAAAAADGNGQCSASDAKGVSAANLAWGVKESFRSYIKGSIAKGDWDTSGVNYSNSAFQWSGNSGAVSSGKGAIQYSGSVHFTGHGGILDLTIADPEITWDGNSGTLIATVNSSDMDGNKQNFGRVELASLGVNANGGDSSVDGSATVSLTETGAKAFADFYTAGTQLDGLTFNAKLGGDANCTEAAASGSVGGAGGAGGAKAATAKAAKAAKGPNGELLAGRNGSATSLLGDSGNGANSEKPEIMLAAVSNPGIPIGLALIVIAAMAYPVVKRLKKDFVGEYDDE